MSSNVILSRELAKVLGHIENARNSINAKYEILHEPDPISSPLYSGQLASAIDAIFVLYTDDATIYPEDIPEGLIGYARKEQIIGTMKINPEDIMFKKRIWKIDGIATKDDTALAEHVLAGKTFHARGDLITGTMQTIHIDETLNVNKKEITIPIGYSDGTSKVSIILQEKTCIPSVNTQNITPDSDKVLSKVKVEGDPDLKPENIKKGINIFGVTGTSEECSMTGTNATSNDILAGKIACVNKNKITGNIQSIAAKTYIPSTVDQIINSGKYLAGNQTIKGDPDLKPENIKKGINIFNVIGTLEENTSTEEGYVTVYGSVIDGTNNTVIPQFAELIYRPQGTKTGTGKLFVATIKNGTYKMILPKNSSFTTEVNTDGYMQAFIDISIGSNSTQQQDYILSPKLKDNEVLRAIVTWGETPADLDTQVCGNYNRNKFEFNYKYTDGIIKTYNGTEYIPGTTTIPELGLIDVDCREGHGPETFTLYKTNCNFIYRIHNFSGSLGSSETMVNGECTVTVYTNSGSESRTISADRSYANALVWHVFKYNNGTVTWLDKYCKELKDIPENEEEVVPGTGGNPIDPTPTDPTTYSSNNVDVWDNFNTKTIENTVATKWGYYSLSKGCITSVNVDKCLTLYRRIYNIAKNNGVLSSYSYIKYGNTEEISNIQSKDTVNISGGGTANVLLVYHNDLGISDTVVITIHQYVFMDNPELMMKWNLMGSQNGFLIFDYYNETKRQSYISKCNSTFNEINTKIQTTYGITFNSSNTFAQNYTTYTNDQKKKIAKVIHDFIILNSKYSFNAPDKLNQTMYPALSKGTQDPVCASYGHAFCWCCHKWGIPASVVLGLGDPVRADSYHLWSMACYTTKPLPSSGNPWDNVVNQNTEWQEVDLTWDEYVSTDSSGHYLDPYPNDVMWKFFNKTTSEFTSSGHVRKMSNSSGTPVENSVYVKLPSSNCTCTSNTYSYDSSRNGGTKYGGF